MISIDWGTKVIHVPKSDTTLIQATPTEIRELNLNTFRLALKDLEDGEDGVHFPITHNHNTEVSLGGIVYARIIEIINGYTVTFEDGAWAVNLVGANSNVADVVNVNQVSVRSANAAGLISNQAIEYSSFNGFIAINTNTGSTGTTFPKGTLQAPVNNLADAIAIAQYRGIETMQVEGTLVIANTDVSSYKFIGENPLKAVVVLSGSGNTTNATAFHNLILTGRVNGHVYVKECALQSLSNVGGSLAPSVFYDCIFRANVGVTPCIQINNSITTPQNVHFINCVDGVPGSNSPTIDFNNSLRQVSVRKYGGKLEIKNYTQASNHCSFDFDHGTLYLSSLNSTAGTITSRGIGEIIDENGDNVGSGIWNGITIDNHLLNPKTLISGLLNENITTYDNNDSLGEMLQKIKEDTKIIKTISYTQI